MDVALFVTCLTDTFFPRVGAAIVRVLRHFGCRVHFPTSQTCCGQPAFNAGHQIHAARLLRRMTDVFAPYETIVTPSASCATMVKIHGPTLFGADPQGATAARQLADKTWEFSTFLRDRLNIDLAQHLRFNEPVTFHYPCHARETYSLDDLRGWLSGNNNDLRIPERPDLCCGFGGVFAVDYPEVSSAMTRDKLAQLQATNAKLVVSNEAGCTLQMAGLAQRQNIDLRFKHIAECLAEALGLMEPES